MITINAFFYNIIILFTSCKVGKTRQYNMDPKVKSLKSKRSVLNIYIVGAELIRIINNNMC